MEKELRAEDLFVKDKPVQTNEVAPEYEVIVKLSSVGKLGLPAVIHVRDYTFDDTLLFAKANEMNETAVILELLKNVVYEDIDLSKVTRQDALEILMAIQGTFYSGYVEREYLVNENLTGEALIAKENRSKVSIPVNSIKTVPISNNVTVPIRISNGKFEALFDYPRLVHDKIAKDYVENKFAERDNELSSLFSKKASGTASSEELKILSDYDEEKGTEYMRVLTALQIISMNDKKCENLEEQITMLHKMPMVVLSLLANILNTRFNFGVQDEVTFDCEVTGQQITRRFNFRYSDFIPAMEQGDVVGFDVSFG